MRTTLIIAGTVVVLGGGVIWYGTTANGPYGTSLETTAVESGSTDQNASPESDAANAPEPAPDAGAQGPVEEVIETREEAERAAERIAQQAAAETEETAEQAPDLLAQAETEGTHDTQSLDGDAQVGQETGAATEADTSADTEAAITASDPATPAFGDSDPGIESGGAVGDEQIVGDTPWELEVLFEEDGRIDVDALDAYFEEGEIPAETRDRARTLLEEIREAPQADAVTDRVEELREILNQSM